MLTELEAARDKLAAQTQEILELKNLLENEIRIHKESKGHRNRLIVELQNLRASLKALNGLLPICASCKKIRDDQGFWQAVEAYVGNHSGALFSHGLCPDCMQKLYPELFGEPDEKNVSGSKFLFIDELTGLHNRRGLVTQLEERGGSLSGPEEAIVVVLADIDHLLRINELYGFTEGDRALVDATNVLRATFRGSDIIARLGGDEFIVIAAGSTLDNADRILNRLVSYLEDHNKKNQRPFRLSLSAKTIAYEPGKASAIAELMKIVDEFVYHHKIED